MGGGQVHFALGTLGRPRRGTGVKLGYEGSEEASEGKDFSSKCLRGSTYILGQSFCKVSGQCGLLEEGESGENQLRGS